MGEKFYGIFLRYKELKHQRCENNFIALCNDFIASILEIIPNHVRDGRIGNKALEVLFNPGKSSLITFT
jgi:hypothetical protein